MWEPRILIVSNDTHFKPSYLLIKTFDQHHLKYAEFIYDYMYICAIFLISSNFMFFKKGCKNYLFNYISIILLIICFIYTERYIRERKYIYVYTYKYLYLIIYVDFFPEMQIKIIKIKN